jgi:uncharacterized SAM-binding protein YcdF (DUF218 family)
MVAARPCRPHAPRPNYREKGVPEWFIWTEERSTSTHQNALFGAEILKRHGIRRVALVVDARSMPRAEACFRKQGITVAPAPSFFTHLERNTDDFLPGWSAIRRSEGALHETLSLAWYCLRGWMCLARQSTSRVPFFGILLQHWGSRAAQSQ